MNSKFFSPYRLNDNQKFIVNAYFDHMVAYFLDPWFNSDTADKNDKDLVEKSILLAMSPNMKEKDFHLYLTNKFPLEILGFMHAPLLDIYRATHQDLNKDLRQVLDYRLYKAAEEATEENISEKKAVGEYLSTLIKRYLREDRRYSPQEVERSESPLRS